MGTYGSPELGTNDNRTCDKNLIYCQKCGFKYSKRLKRCPQCGAKHKTPFYKKWWVWAIVIVVIIGVASGGNNTNPNDMAPDTDNSVPVNEPLSGGQGKEDANAPETQTETPVKNSPKITLQEFESIQTGMSYEQVCEIVGGTGEISSQSSVAGYEMAIYIWEGSGTLGANANVTFQNGKVCAKAQFGLK